MVSVDTLEYLVRGGRIGKAAGMVGQLLSVRPILQIANGEVEPLTRVRGASKVLGALEREFDTAPADGPLRVAIASSPGNDLPDRVAEMVARVRPDATLELRATLGAVIGTYAGPGALGLLWVPEAPKRTRAGAAA